MGDTQARHERLRTTFESVLLEAPEARQHYIDRACGDDRQLREQVARLLSAHAKAGSFLETPPSLPSDTNDFAGTARFTVVRRLGAGGMGVVYEARDNQRGELVALKTLRHAGAADLYRLKREFRALADVAHRNLVCLYELFVDEHDCFFTMELVDGVNLIEYVRSNPAGEAHGGLRRILPQLVQGIAAIHRAGRLHRDIKPSNILVTSTSRVVILDFGLAVELHAPHEGAQGDAGGTPAYMAPEAAFESSLTEASDWYSVGATLYEALTGNVPFTGSLAECFAGQHASNLPPPRDVVPEVPADLSEACMRLLHPDPALRIDGRELAMRLCAPDSDGLDGATAPGPVFVGRARHLEILRTASADAQRQSGVRVLVTGGSGIGKTTLVRRFLDETIAGPRALVFSDRCHEHESLPYKALDGVIDGLADYLRWLPAADRDTLIPDDVEALSRLFPYLTPLRPGERRRQRSDDQSDPILLRQRAVAALRQLLSSIAARQPVVIAIDDMQWADADGVDVLTRLLEPRAPRGLLTILCARSEGISAAPFVQELFTPVSDADVLLPLEPMNARESSQLLAALLAGGPADKRGADTLTIDAGGNPFLLEQIASFLSRTSGHDGVLPTFAEAIESGLLTLSTDARRVLEMLAVCGRPIAADTLAAAASLTGALRPLLASLRIARFIRSSGPSDRIEPYHDRIRESLVARLSAESIRDIHRRMADAVAASGVDDPETLFEHYLGAGDRRRAAVQAGAAAERAAGALAFDRAASYFRQALELNEGSSPPDWQVGLATALANAGRPPEAARAYIAAAALAAPPARVELQRRGAEQLLVGGHIDAGLDVVRTVLDELGMQLARGPYQALVSIVLRRALLRLRGLSFVQRSAEEIAAGLLLRADTSWSIMTGLATVDMIRAADFSLRHLLLALETGEPARIARALAVQGAFSAMAGGPGDGGSERFLVRARGLSERLDDPRTTAVVALSTGIAAVGLGRWRSGISECDRALAILRDRCTGVTWELNAGQNFVLGALLYAGEIAEAASRLPALLADARTRGNLYVETELCTRMNLVWLGADRPDEGDRLAAGSIGRWSQQGFHRQHYSAALARAQTRLYCGDADAAWRVQDECWIPLQRTMLRRAQMVRVEASFLRGRCALAMAVEGRDRRRFLSIARHHARRIARERMPWSDPIGLLLSAGIARLDGDVSRCRSLLIAAIDGFDRAAMGLYAAVARRRLAAVGADDHAQQAMTDANVSMAAQDIRNPAAMTRMLAPGFPA